MNFNHNGSHYNNGMNMSHIVMPKEIGAHRFTDMLHNNMMSDGSIPVQMNKISPMTQFLDANQPYVKPDEDQDAWIANYNWDAIKMQNTNFINEVIASLPPGMSAQKKAAYVSAMQSSNLIQPVPVGTQDVVSNVSHYGTIFNGARHTKFQHGYVKPKVQIDMKHFLN